MYKTQLSATEHYWSQDSTRSGFESAVLRVTLETPASGTGGYRLESNRQRFPISMDNIDTPYLLNSQMT